MKKAALIFLMIAVVVTPAAAWPQGSLTIKFGAKVKWLYTYQREDDNAESYGGKGVENFRTSNVEWDLSGTVGDRVAFLIELQAAANNPAWAGGPDEMGPIGVRQAKIIFSDFIPRTTVTVGSFNLPVGNYQPRATNEWDLINLPLINQTVWTGAFIPPGQWGVYQPVGLGWQATGVDFSFALMDQVKIDFAYFNGYALSPNLDLDLEKSWLANFHLQASEAASLGVAYLNEGWEEPTPGGHSAHRRASGWVISGAFVNDKIEANFDWMMMTADHYMRDRQSNKTDLSWMGYQVTFGYWVWEFMEVVIRYEWIDPNREDDAKLDKKAFNAVSPGPYNIYTNYDQLSWFTLGVNVRLNDCSEVAVNYIIREEQGQEIDEDHGYVPDPLAPTGGPKYQKLDNDLFLIQVQIWQ